MDFLNGKGDKPDASFNAVFWHIGLAGAVLELKTAGIEASLAVIAKDQVMTFRDAIVHFFSVAAGRRVAVRVAAVSFIQIRLIEPDWL